MNRHTGATSAWYRCPQGVRADMPIACSVGLGRAVYQAQAHSGLAALLSGAGQEVLDDERRGRRGALDEPEEGTEVPGGGETWQV